MPDAVKSKIVEPFSSSVVYTCETEKTGEEEAKMHSISKAFLTFIFVMGAFSAISVQGQPAKEANRTLSPYFFVKSDDAAVDQFPLKSTSADVKVIGVIADVVVTQIYKNEGEKPLEAIYIFPASTRAAVYGMKMTVGKRTIIAKIQESKEARRQYEEARQQGKSASLLEQQRPNVFQMNVANILPGDLIQVELKYTELLVPTDGIYEFVYPTVVGPRYSNQPAETALPSHKWIENPYSHQGESPAYTFDITVALSAGLPIQNIACTSHKTDIRYDGPSRATMKLDALEKDGGTRDFILKYQLAGGKVQSGLLLFEGESENFFLLMLQPPKRVKTNQISPREYIFIVDVSGSMYGFPLDISKKLLKDLIGNLRSTDKFNVLLFSGGSSLMSEQSLPATPENIRRAIDLIERQRGGGTELLPALKRVLSLARSEGYSRSVVIATDGYVTVEEEVFDLIRKNLGNANMFTFGIGSSVNRHLLEGMARVGMGEPFTISKPEETREKAEKFRKMIESPVLTRVKVDFGKFNVYTAEPLGIPDVFAERPVIVFGKWCGRPGGEITLSGMTANGPYVNKIDIRKEKPMKSNSALRYLWARHRITLLSDYNFLHQDDARIKEVTQLGLTYNLLTAYTSFVAIDTGVRLVDGQAVTVKQPLPLPEGVSDYAVGEGRAKQVMVPASAPYAASRTQEYGQSSLKEELRDKSIASKPLQAFVELKEITTTSGLTKEAIQKAVKQQISSIENCYRKILEKKPGVQGNATFQLTIDSKGRAAKVSLISSKLNDKNLEQFIVQKIKESIFPVPQGTDTVTATVSFNLKTS